MTEPVTDLLYRGPEALDPSDRKARGVFYTPPHVVDFIVQNTVVRLLRSCKTPKEAFKLRILDPACGTGCFLAGAYECLAKWHKKAGVAAQIVANNLFGVDIDEQAVLRARQVLGKLSGSDRPVGNVRVGNALIAGDLKPVDHGLRPFDWQSEFGQVMSSGGFDCVLGNPPYVFTRGQGFSRDEKAYFKKNYRHQNYQLNTYALFVEKSLSLLREGGVCGLIMPSNWLTVSSMKPFRDFLLASTGELRIINNVYPVFPGVSVDTSMVLFTRKKPGRVQLLESSGPRQISKVASVPVRELLKQKVIQIGMYKDSVGRKIVERIESCSRPLDEFAKVSTGLKAYQTGKGRPPQTSQHKKDRIFHFPNARDPSCRRYLEGRDVCRYRLDWSGGYLAYGDWLAEPRRSVPFQGPRLLVRQIPAKPPFLVHAVYTDEDFCHDINSMVIHRPVEGISLKYLLGLLNSRLMSTWFMKRYDKLQRRIFPQFKVGELKTFPIVPVGPHNQALHDHLVKLVNRRLNNPQAHESQDLQIDSLVCDLYGLSHRETEHILR